MQAKGDLVSSFPPKTQACDMFILELTLRSWIHSEENKRRTLQRNDIAAAITKTDIFDFLVRRNLCLAWTQGWVDISALRGPDTRPFRWTLSRGMRRLRMMAVP